MLSSSSINKRTKNNTSSSSSSSIFSALRYYVGNTILLTMGVSIASLYTITQIFRLYKSLRPEAALHRDVCLSGVRMFLNRLLRKQQQEQHQQQAVKNNQNEFENQRDFLFHQREIIWKQIQLVHSTLHEHGATFSSIVIPEWTVSLVHTLLPSSIFRLLISSSSSSLHPWVTNPDVRELRKLGEMALDESIKRCDKFHQNEMAKSSSSSSSSNEHHCYNLSGVHFLHIRGLYRCSQEYNIDIPFWSFLRFKQWWMRKKGAFAGYCRAMALLLEACFPSPRKNSHHANEKSLLNFSLVETSERSGENQKNSSSSLEHHQQNETLLQETGEELLELMKTSSSRRNKTINNKDKIHLLSIITSLPRKLIIGPIAAISDWIWKWQRESARSYDKNKNNFSLVQLRTWPFLLRVSLLIVFDGTRHLINRHTRQVIGFGSAFYSALSSFYGGVRTSEEADMASVSVFFVTTILDILVTRLSTSMDHQFSQVLGREATFALATTNLETLEHMQLKLDIENRWENHTSSGKTKMKPSESKLVFGSEYYFDDNSNNKKNSSSSSSIINPNAASGDSNYKRHYEFLYEVGRDSAVTFSSSAQVSVTAAFLLLDFGWIAYSYFSSSSSSNDNNSTKIVATHHFKALIVAFLWKQIDDTFVQEFLSDLFKRPIEQISELASLFSKTQSDDEVFSGKLLKKSNHQQQEDDNTKSSSSGRFSLFSSSASKMLDTEKWEKFLPLSIGGGADGGKTLYGCDLLLTAKIENNNDNNGSSSSTTTPFCSALTFALTTENESCAPFAFSARLKSFSSNKKQEVDFVNQTVCNVIKRITRKNEDNPNDNTNTTSTNKQVIKKHKTSKTLKNDHDSSKILEYVVDPGMPNLVVLDRDELKILANKHAVQHRIYVVDHSAPAYNIALTDEEFLTLRIFGLEVVSSMCGLRLRREKMFENLLNRTAKDILDPHQNVLFDVLQLFRRYLGQQLGLFLFADFSLSSALPSFSITRSDLEKIAQEIFQNPQEFVKNLATSSSNLITNFFTKTGLWFDYSYSSSKNSNNNNIPQKVLHNIFGLPGRTMTWPHTVEYYVRLIDDADERLTSERIFIHFEYFNTYIQELMTFTPLIDTMRASSDQNYPFFVAPEFSKKNNSDDENDDDDDENIQSFLPLKIEFRNVSFSYRNDNKNNNKNNLVYSLQNLSFTVNPGETIGVAGESGAGKSSILKLLLRLYDPTSGDIFINDVNLKSIKDVRAWRRNAVAYMDQQPLLSNNATIRETVEFGRQLPKDVVEEALEKAHCSVFIDKLGPDALNTPIGNKFSSGERQRLAIARVFAKTAPILLLDEATSALDAVSEGIVVENCLKHVTNNNSNNNNNGNGNGKTSTIVVAHRLSTLKNADKILVMGRGGVMLGFDTHENLLQTCTEYQELCDRQRLLKGIEMTANANNNNDNGNDDEQEL